MCPSTSTILRTTDGGVSWKRQVTGSDRALFVCSSPTRTPVGRSEKPALSCTQRPAANHRRHYSAGDSAQRRNERECFLSNLIAGIVAAALSAGTAAAQAIVIGTGKPDIDIPASSPPSIGRHDRAERTFLLRQSADHARNAGRPYGCDPVSKQVTISARGTCTAKCRRFTAEKSPSRRSSGADVRITGIAFRSPQALRVFVDAVSGFAIDSCAIESVQRCRLCGTQREIPLR
jgi:hypothetical protein